MAQPITKTTNNWLHDFPELKLSTQEFYSQVEASLSKTEIPKIRTERINLNQAGIFSTKREYLRVSSAQQLFDICAAPFGNGFFVSLWYRRSTCGKNKTKILSNN